jgi:hypothetical protein
LEVLTHQESHLLLDAGQQTSDPASMISVFVIPSVMIFSVISLSVNK